MNQEEHRHIDFDQVARYLSNEMSSEERSGFESLVDSSADLKDEFNKLSTIWSNAQDYSAFDTEGAWGKLDNKIKLQEDKKPETKTFSLRWTLRVAAAVVFLAVAGYLYRSNQKTDFVNVVAEVQTSQELPDGSLAEIRPGSSIEFAESFDGDQRTVKLKGEAFFQVTHNPDKPFIVETEMGSVQVLGTEFNVNQTEDGQFEITVKSGKVQVTDKDGRDKKILTKDQAATFNPITGQFELKYHTASLYWLTKSIKFTRTDFRTLFNVLEKNFDVKFSAYNAIDCCEVNSTLHKGMTVHQFIQVIDNGDDLVEFVKIDSTTYEVKGSCPE